MSQTKSADVAPFSFNAIQTVLVFTQKEVFSYAVFDHEICGANRQNTLLSVSSTHQGSTYFPVDPPPTTTITHPMPDLSSLPIPAAKMKRD